MKFNGLLRQCFYNKQFECLLISILSLICYSKSIFGDIVFDDTEAILNNKDVMTDTPLFEVFTNDFWGTKITHNSSHKSYRPLTVIVFRWIRHFSTFIDPKSLESTENSLNPILFHLFNVTFYLLTNILLLEVLNRLLNIFCVKERHSVKTNQRNAFLATILFSCHPIHSEVVCACVGLADLLSTVFVLKGLLIYIKFTENPSHCNYVKFTVSSILITLVSGIAMLFKEQGITFTGLCVLFDLIMIYERRANISAKLLSYRIFCLFSGTLLLVIFRLKIMNFSGPEFQRGDNPTSFENWWLIRIINFNYIYSINSWILIYPVWLCFDWSMGCIPLIKHLTDFRILFVIIFWIVSLFLIKCSLFHQNSRIRCQTQISLAFGLVTFIPSMNIFFTVGFVVAERALFLPSIGYVLLIVNGINSLENRFKCSKILYPFLVLLTMVYTLRSIERQIDWMNEKRLFDSGLNVCPSNAKIHYNVAKTAGDLGLKQKAVDEYREAIRLNPDYDQAMNNLANILKDSGNLVEAKQLLEKALEIRSSFSAAWMNLGIVQMNLNQYSEAENSYFNALKHRNKYAECYYNLGNLYVKQKRLDDAYRVWRNATLIKPKLLSAWNNLIILLDNIGSYEKAVEIAEEALKYHSKQSSLHFNFGNVLGKMKKFNESEEQFKIAILLNPENANYYYNLGVLYHQIKDYDRACYNYQMTLNLNPDHKSAEKHYIIAKQLAADNLRIGSKR